MMPFGRPKWPLLLITIVVTTILALNSPIVATNDPSTNLSNSSTESITNAAEISVDPVLGSDNITPYNGSDTVNFTVAASPGGSPPYPTSRSIESIQKEIVLKINRGNEPVSIEGRRLIGNLSGARRIDQICAIYDFLVDEKNWTYVSDWYNLEQFQYSNNTLKMGKDAGGMGKGDCDDFAILLSALVESVGASPRIVFAYGPTGGHAYAEVYLGKANGPGSDVDRMIRWLQYTYKVNDIKVHKDLANGDVWLNLDWWKDPNTGEELATHPGGPFYSATTQVVVYPEDSTQGKKGPLTPVDLPPIVMFQVSPEVPTIGMNASFNASKSFDVDGNITSYKWDFGDGQSGDGKEAVHSYLKAGAMTVNLTATDDQDLNGSNSTEVQVNQPPVAIFSFEPANPMVGDQIEFNAGKSRDPDGKIIRYDWEFGDGDTGVGASKLHTYAESGTFNVKLTVLDDDQAQDTEILPVNVSGVKITNLTNGDSVSQHFDLMGEYSPSDSNKSIWIFVKPEEENSSFYPQSLDSCHPSNASMLKGRWETRITLGGSNDEGKFFDIIVTLADENADQLIRNSMYEWWCPEFKGDRSIAGFNDLPVGVRETDSIRVIRSDEFWTSQDISNANLPGIVNLVELRGDSIRVRAPRGSDNASVEESMTVFGNRSNDTVDQIWVLVHSINGRWYPQSIDNHLDHVTNLMAINESSPDWHIRAGFSGTSGNLYDLVVVLANSPADDFFNRFQKSCATAKNPDGNTGNWPGLLTIALPSGIDEKDRVRVQRYAPTALLENASEPKPTIIIDDMGNISNWTAFARKFSPNLTLVNDSNDKAIRIGYDLEALGGYCGIYKGISSGELNGTACLKLLYNTSEDPKIIEIKLENDSDGFVKKFGEISDVDPSGILLVSYNDTECISNSKGSCTDNKFSTDRISRLGIVVSSKSGSPGKGWLIIKDIQACNSSQCY